MTLIGLVLLGFLLVFIYGVPAAQRAIKVAGRAFLTFGVAFLIVAIVGGAWLITDANDRQAKLAAAERQTSIEASRRAAAGNAYLPAQTPINDKRE